MERELLQQLETPCIVIDTRKAKENIAAMQTAADNCGCRLRPHIKTHKMPLFAAMQVAAGAAGITCAKVSEAEAMAAGGIDDIFIAYPMVGEFRIRRAISLAGRIKRLILAVDSLAGAQLLNSAAQEAGFQLEVRLEVDTGAGRTGVVRSQVVGLAQEIVKLKFLRLTGIYTFKSLVFNAAPTLDRQAAGAEEGELLDGISRELAEAGICLEDISGGSSPTGQIVAATGKVNEIRPGTYIFNDFMLYKEGAARISDIAARIYATVVSTPNREYAVIDGGTKTFPMDIMVNSEPFYYPGYAVVEGNDDLALLRMNEEHGMLVSQSGDTKLCVGDIVTLIPIHICTAINMQNDIYLYDGRTLSRQPVTARGMLV